ncbi:MAG: phosphate signaling complex protein PhoU [Chloroflexi bacterium]|nr:phosphate signaling complex protein PhoU [Chloroflexota bacterium]
MTRALLEKQLQEIQDEVLELGGMVERAILGSIETLKKQDLEMAQLIITEDVAINQKRFHIEERCIQLMATQQPVASDLRQIVAMIHIIVDLERMADHAEGIAKITLLIGKEPLIKPLIDIPRMAQKGVEMLRRSLEAFTQRNVEAAKGISEEDDEVDALYDQVYRELLVLMLQDPRIIQRATYLIWVAHNLERIADRVTNICERVVFTATGHMVEMNVSKY